MSLKNIAIGLNVLLMLLCVGFFVWTWTAEESDVVEFCNTWFVAPIVNLLYIRKNSIILGYNLDQF